jgi:hypothetical protein
MPPGRERRPRRRDGTDPHRARAGAAAAPACHPAGQDASGKLPRVRRRHGRRPQVTARPPSCAALPLSLRSPAQPSHSPASWPGWKVPAAGAALLRGTPARARPHAAMRTSAERQLRISSQCRRSSGHGDDPPRWPRRCGCAAVRPRASRSRFDPGRLYVNRWTGPAPVREARTTGMWSASLASTGATAAGTCPAPNATTTGRSICLPRLLGPTAAIPVNGQVAFSLPRTLPAFLACADRSASAIR